MAPESRTLEKWVWNDADFKRMGWHDNAIHGIATISEFPDRLELMLDIDYIFDWVNQGSDRPFLLWVAPATLVFENVYHLKLDIESAQGDIELDEILREDERLA